MRPLPLLLTIGLILSPNLAIAQTPPAVLTLRPHCENVNQQECAAFAVENPSTLKTPFLKMGDTLDIDIVIHNPGNVKISRVRSWLTYDPTVLEGKTLEIAKTFAVPIPGESNFSATDGYAKIGAGTEMGKEIADATVVVARVQFTVKKVPAGGKSAIGFYDAMGATDSHSAVIVNALSLEQNILTPTLGSLLVLMEGAPNVVASSSRSSVSAAERTAFILLQVQNVRITTEGTAIFLAWDSLKSGELQGYNIYYGTEMGRYIQRKSVDSAVPSLALRGLPADTTYYVAIRGVSKSNEESAFSREVAVKVGDPKSSTSPLTGNFSQGPAGKNPLDRPGKTATAVPGESGPTSHLALFLLFSGIAGTLFAFRRQMIASIHSKNS